MYPTLFRIGDISIASFSVMVLLSFLVAHRIADSELKRKGYNGGLADALLIAAVVGGIGGAKILFLIQNATFAEIMENPLRYLSSGLTYYGGLIGSLLLIWVVVRRWGVSYWTATDAVAPGLILAYAIGRIGCLLVGDDYGRPSDLPWAMAFPNGAPPTLERVHPTQIYETLIMTGVFFFLWRIRKLDRPLGWMSALTFVLIGTERFFVEFVRDTTMSFIPGISTAQIISLGFIAVGMLRLRHLKSLGAK
ncbi:MAG: prolipoprotein diacylglyceryl transferase [Deltaproteobacteria bacterium]